MNIHQKTVALSYVIRFNLFKLICCMFCRDANICCFYHLFFKLHSRYVVSDIREQTHLPKIFFILLHTNHPKSYIPQHPHPCSLFGLILVFAEHKSRRKQQASIDDTTKSDDLDMNVAAVILSRSVATHRLNTLRNSTRQLHTLSNLL